MRDFFETFLRAHLKDFFEKIINILKNNNLVGTFEGIFNVFTFRFFIKKH
jgi:hypothetical protein